jgi:hypothetical protein
LRHHCNFIVLLPAALLALTAPMAGAEWRPNGSPVAARAGAVLASNGRGGVFAATGYPGLFTLLYQLNASGDSAMAGLSVVANFTPASPSWSTTPRHP